MSLTVSNSWCRQAYAFWFDIGGKVHISVCRHLKCYMYIISFAQVEAQNSLISKLTSEIKLAEIQNKDILKVRYTRGKFLTRIIVLWTLRMCWGSLSLKIIEQQFCAQILSCKLRVYFCVHYFDHTPLAHIIINFCHALSAIVLQCNPLLNFCCSLLLLLTNPTTQSFPHV